MLNAVCDDDKINLQAIEFANMDSSSGYCDLDRTRNAMPLCPSPTLFFNDAPILKLLQKASPLLSCQQFGNVDCKEKRE